MKVMDAIYLAQSLLNPSGEERPTIEQICAVLDAADLPTTCNKDEKGATVTVGAGTAYVPDMYGYVKHIPNPSVYHNIVDIWHTICITTGSACTREKLGAAIRIVTSGHLDVIAGMAWIESASCVRRVGEQWSVGGDRLYYVEFNADGEVVNITLDKDVSRIYMIFGNNDTECT
jgi:hypothetical protein